MRLDDIKARVAAGPSADEQLLRMWVDAHSTDLMSLHEARISTVLTDLAHARTDIPDLLRVVEAAREFLDAEGDFRVLDVYDDSEDVMLASDHLKATRDALRAALSGLDR